jgi:hypothetical protein
MNIEKKVPLPYKNCVTGMCVEGGILNLAKKAGGIY